MLALRPSAGPDKRMKLTEAHLLQKGTSWRCQAEWRCIRKWEPRQRPTANRYYPIETRALIGVIFGWKLTEQDRRQITEWIQMGAWRRNAALKQAQLEDGRVRIRVIPQNCERDEIFKA